MTKGFILIELLISLFIASMLSVGMINALILIYKTNDTVDSRMEVSASAIRLQQQLERDFAGVIVPLSYMAALEEKKKSSQGGAQEKKEPTTKKEEPKKQIKDIFVARTKDAHTNFLSFIMTNPLASFWSDTAGQAQSRLVRVVYRLEPEPNNAPYFRLMRQEGMDLDVQSYDPQAKKSIRALEVISGIKNFSFTFLVEDSKEQEGQAEKKGEEKQQQEKKTVTYKLVNEWIQEPQEKLKKQKEPLYPRYAQLSLVIVSKNKKVEETFKYIFPLLCHEGLFAKKEKQQQLDQPKEGGIRARIAQAKGNPAHKPSGLLAQFTQHMGVHA